MPDQVAALPARLALVLGTSTGGVGQHVRVLARRLAEQGVQVLVAGPASTEQAFGFTQVGARFAAVEIPASPHPRADAAAVLRLRTVLVGEDLVHAHGLRAGLVCSLAGAHPLVVTWHNQVLGSPLRQRVLGVLERVVARRTDLTLGASSDLVERARSLGAPDARLAEVAAPTRPAPAAAPDVVRASLGVPEGRLLVVTVGRLHAQKGLDVLVDAAARWGATGPQVVVAGDGPLRGELQARIDRTGAPVSLLGHREDVPDLLAAADVVVLPSVWEARSLVVQEAMALGRPVVTTSVGGLPGLVGDAAVVVAPGDVTALADGVTALLADPARAAELGRRARERAAGWTTEQQMVDELVGHYRRLAPGAAW